MKTQVIYVSGTGNTEKIAEAIYRKIPSPFKDIKRLDSCFEKCSADLYFIGFWANRGSASVEVLDYLSELHGKRIALFATCGMGNSPTYFKQIENSVAAFIPDDNEYLGAFLCPGKMPMRVRQKYEQMLDGSNHAQAERLIQHFDQTILHPDRNDLSAAQDFAERTFKQLQER